MAAQTACLASTIWHVVKGTTSDNLELGVCYSCVRMHNCNCYTIQRDNQLFCKTNNDTSKILLEKQYYNIQSLICWDKLKKPIVYWKTNFGESIFHAHNERIKKPFHWHFWKGYNITEEKSKQRGSLTQKVSPQKHRQHQFSWQVSIALIWLIGKCNQSLKFHSPNCFSLWDGNVSMTYSIFAHPPQIKKSKITEMSVCCLAYFC